MLETADSVPLAVLALVLALALAAWFVRDPSVREPHRYAAIDGLRAFLSPMVLIHHATIWYTYGHFHAWGAPGTSLFRNFGSTSVYVFFMITSFLFCSKLIEARTRKMDWLHLYVSRLLRITPLYWCAIAVVVFLVGLETHFRQVVPTPELWSQLQRWALFTVNGAVDINGFTAWLMTAGVTWTLPYEWYFYCLMPVIALAIGVRRSGESPIWLILGVITAFSLGAWGLRIDGLYPFVGGAVAAVVVHTPGLPERLKGRGANLLTVLCIWLSYVALPSNATMPSLVLLTTGFVFIACGVNVFGALTWRPMRALSALSYGIYLWHGIVLFVAMRYGVGWERLPTLSPRQHWLVVLGCVPVIVGLAAITFHWVERPAMRSVPAVTRWLRGLLTPEPAVAGAHLDDATKPS